MKISEVERNWEVNLSAISNQGKTEKRFDFVVKNKNNELLLIETNFYRTSGSKLNETARSYAKLGQDLKEIKGVEARNYELGQEIKADIFDAGEIVDVTGTSKGKGFQGVIKRHNQSRGPMGHGSQYHRGVGSLGTMLPMHVIKGKKMPGHMGNVQRTVQNLEVVSIDTENNVILIKGNI